MNISVYKKDRNDTCQWSEASSLYEALKDVLLHAHSIYAVGAGGKTTLIDLLAYELAKRNQRTVITTTTHRYAPMQYDCTGQQYERLKQQLALERIAVIGTPCIETKNGMTVNKITEPDRSQYEKAAQLADYMLVEADGSRHLPLKYPNQSEPVLRHDCDVCMIVAGLSALGQTLASCCHRYELACQAQKSNLCGSAIVNESDIVWLITFGYIRQLIVKNPKLTYIVVLNQADDSETKSKGKLILHRLFESENSIALGLVTSMKSTQL